MKKSVIFLLMVIILVMQPEMISQAAVQSDYTAVFDAQYYYNNYPDLQTAIGNNPEQLFLHFLNSGMKEGRVANAEFNVRDYMNNYVDLQQAFGKGDLTAYYKHYISNGKNEGRLGINNGTIPNKPVVMPADTENLIAVYSTAYATGTNRAVNLELAAARINNYVIQPRDIFSFSNSILSRTVENGYVVAPSFSAGIVVESVGGGICQVSSTFYAALKSYSIPVLERHVHSLKVSYIPEEYDATVSEGAKDLRYKNSNNYPVRVQTQVKDGVLTVALYKVV